MKKLNSNGPGIEAPEPTVTKTTPIQRLERVEQDVTALKTRQEGIYEDTLEHQKSMLQQQATVFNLLIQQRSAIDKILAKMGGL